MFVGEGSSPGWRLTVDGQTATRSPAFGWANAFEVPAGGQASLRYETSPLRWVAIVVQVLCWLVALWLALRIGLRRSRRAAAGAADAAVLIDLDDQPLPVTAAPTPAPPPGAGSVAVATEPAVSEPPSPRRRPAQQRPALGRACARDGA